MKICEDCRYVAIGAESALDFRHDTLTAARRWVGCLAGLDAMPPGRAGDLVDEHGTDRCDCCGDRAHGQRYGWLTNSRDL